MLPSVSNISIILLQEELLLFGNIMLKSKNYKKAIELFLTGIQTMEEYSKK